MDWKKEAKKALRAYPKAKARGDDTSAIDIALEQQKAYYNGAERMRMVDLVYFRRSHTITGAAMEVQYSPEAVQRWNAELVHAAAAALRAQKMYSFHCDICDSVQSVPD